LLIKLRGQLGGAFLVVVGFSSYPAWVDPSSNLPSSILFCQVEQKNYQEEFICGRIMLDWLTKHTGPVQEQTKENEAKIK
jgi:hypothetical protein